MRPGDRRKQIEDTVRNNIVTDSTVQGFSIRIDPHPVGTIPRCNKSWNRFKPVLKAPGFAARNSNTINWFLQVLLSMSTCTYRTWCP